ncbi:MAG: relaxase/mobilization nuclease domain-containing protein [Clostridia bacterium]|nr:relaxase/mobilization nuclease domain-containing protein [Clostridia bacterium]
MATVNFLSCSSKQTSSGLGSTLNYCEREAKTVCGNEKLVTGINCDASNAHTEMMCTKNQYGKTDGRMYYHLVQSFSPEEKIKPEVAHKVACEFARDQFKGYEVVVATHVDAEHIHSHFVINSVSFENGKKYHSGKDNIQKLRDASDAICKKYGLSVIKQKSDDETKNIGTREYRSALKGESWKISLAVQIDNAMTRAKTKDEFLEIMKSKGYQVAWSDNRKYITYTTPEGKKCRDKSLHETKYLKEEMTLEFKIRSKIIRGENGNAQEYSTGREAEYLRDSDRSQLDWSNQRSKEADGNDLSYGRSNAESHDTRRTDRLSESDSGALRCEGTRFGNDYSSNSDSCGNEAADFGRQNRETGWEPEREICFGLGNGQDESDGGAKSVYEEEPMDIDASCDFVLDTAGDILGILASVGGTGNDPDEEDKKHKQYVTEHQDGGGSKMSM